MAFNISEEDKIISEINITPLTDVALVLLIIFIVTTPLIIQSGVKVNLPESTITDLLEAERIVITVSKEKNIYLNDIEVGIGYLDSYLRKLVENESKKTVIINADKDVSHGYVVEILDIVKKAGTKNLAIATHKK